VQEIAAALNRGDAVLPASAYSGMLRLEVDAIRSRFQAQLSALSDRVLLDIDKKAGKSSGSSSNSSSSRYADEDAAKGAWDLAVKTLDEQSAAEFGACVGSGTAVAHTLGGEFAARTEAAKAEQLRHFLTAVIAHRTVSFSTLH
jgi:hypothetical protein